MSVVWLLRQVIAIVGGLVLTFAIVGDDSWFETPVPDRGIVFLIVFGLGAGFLVCTGVLWPGSSGLPEEERAQVHKWNPFS